MARFYTENQARGITARAIRKGFISADEPCCLCGVSRGAGSVIRHQVDLLAHFPAEQKRSARQLAAELGWSLTTTYAVLRQLRAEGVVDAPVPAEGFIRLRAA
jgi:hypothetical protein